MNRFMHFRHTNNGQVNSRGGATVAYQVDKNNNVTKFAIARCSDKDNYCRKTGRNLANGRLHGAMLSHAALGQQEKTFRQAMEATMEREGLTRVYHKTKKRPLLARVVNAVGNAADSLVSGRPTH